MSTSKHISCIGRRPNREIISVPHLHTWVMISSFETCTLFMCFGYIQTLSKNSERAKEGGFSATFSGLVLLEVRLWKGVTGNTQSPRQLWALGREGRYGWVDTPGSCNVRRGKGQPDPAKRVQMVRSPPLSLSQPKPLLYLSRGCSSRRCCIQ